MINNILLLILFIQYVYSLQITNSLEQENNCNLLLNNISITIDNYDNILGKWYELFSTKNNYFVYHKKNFTCSSLTFYKYGNTFPCEYEYFANNKTFSTFGTFQFNHSLPITKFEFFSQKNIQYFNFFYFNEDKNILGIVKCSPESKKNNLSFYIFSKNITNNQTTKVFDYLLSKRYKKQLHNFIEIKHNIC